MRWLLIWGFGLMTLLLTACGGEEAPATLTPPEQRLPPTNPTPAVALPTPTIPQTRTPAATPTSAGLVLTIQEPANESVVETATIAVRGRAAPEAVVSLDGRLLEVDFQGNFFTTVELEEGPNVIEIIASDLQGNTASVILSVIYLVP